MTNQVGGNDSLVFDGSSVVIGPDGEVVARAPLFAEECWWFFDTLQDGEEVALRCRLECGGNLEFGELWRALVLGTRDYRTQEVCGFSKQRWWGLRRWDRFGAGGLRSRCEALQVRRTCWGFGMPSEIFLALGSD